MAADRLGAQRRRRPTRAGTVLSHELIVATAIRLVDLHGSDGLSVRRLGAALGADPSAIYRYFTGTDDLVRAVADSLIGRALDGFVPGPSWRAALAEMGERIYAGCLARPRAAVLTAARVTGRVHEIQAVEVGLGILRGAGFGVAAASRSYHAFIDLTLGYAMLDAAALALSGAGDVAAWGDVYAGLPSGSHPNIAACAGSLEQAMSGSAYASALGFFLDGLTLELERGEKVGGRFGGPENRL
ncbi:TetR/AcrR family transcriptional regulator [Paractinoplanes durhamensis]|uniref:TetR family transcriptional regulator n=1 Tax=Paractinoplanes durhamensis TaxID=113563 RepID=A0ABQ3YVP2_9ACTN|nr:TetR/AcrR family transcriptional regulator [Actinoplanes durhamensis]GIE01597.1 TetR family transcriptional regulator [Actinoplanes durhamensis]